MKNQLGNDRNWYSLFFDYSADGILYIENQHIRNCNDAILNLLNVQDKKKIIGLHPAEISPPCQPDGQTSREKADLIMAEVSRVGLCRFPWVHRQSKGDVLSEVLLFSVPHEDRQAMLAVWCDVSQGKAAGKNLIESEKYRALFENATWGVFQCSVDGKLLYINPSMAELFGYDSPEEMISRIKETGAHLYAEASDRKRFIQLMKEKNRVERFEAEFLKKDGTKFWISINAYAVRGEDGSIACYEGNIEDISKRKQTEDKLEESKQFLTDALDFLPDATFAVNPKRKIIVWNRAVEAMTGVSAAEMLGKDFEKCKALFYGRQREKEHRIMDLFWEPEADVEKNYLRVERTGEAICAEAFCPALNGGKGAYVVAKMSHIHDINGNAVAAIESIRDVTAQKETEKELCKSLNRFRLFCENVPLGILQIDADGKISYINSQFEKMFGYALDDLPDTGALSAITKDADKKSSHPHGEMSHYYQEVILICCKDGRERIVQTTSSCIDDNIEIRTYQDVTAQYKIESQLRQSQKMEAIGTLAGGIAHDFNNILGAIIGYTEMAMSKASEEQGTLKRYLDQVLHGSIRARDLVKQILFFSRRTEQTFCPIEMRAIIKDSVKLIRASTPSNIKILQNINASRDVIYADPIQIHQVVMNLCTNAIYAMKGSNGILTIELRDIDLNELRELDTGLPQGSYVRLTVRDTGTGIESSKIHRIFEPFYTTKPSGEGTGMGLAVVHGIVKSCGGTVNVTSELDKGTIVRVYFPLLNNIEVSDKTDGVVKPIHGKERILFVDDEQSLVRLGHTLLSELGYQVTMEVDSLQALKTFRDNPDRFDLVITDYMMPNMTGFELSKQILEIRPDMPIILCTGYSDSISKEAANSAGIREYVLKPLTIQELSAVIQRAVSKKS